MKTKKLFLKVKLKSLAAEAKIIRLEEKRNKRFRNELAEHRRGIVRSESRHTQLAYGFLRGRSYDQIEKSTKWIDWGKVEKMVEKYGVYWVSDMTLPQWYIVKAQQAEAFKAWKAGAMQKAA